MRSRVLTPSIFLVNALGVAKSVDEEEDLVFREERPAIGRTVAAAMIVVILGAVGAGEYALSLGSGSTNEVDLAIIEDDPVHQIDHFYPDKIYVPFGENVTFAIQNGDDETRVLTLAQFNVNVTMVPGTAQRVTFQANKLGTFTFISPKTPPSAISQGRPGPCLEGFFIVTQNATLLTSTSTSTYVAPGSTNCLTSVS
jgi:hypothetical protein